MSFTEENRTDIVALAVGVWGAAPGYDNLNGLAAHFNAGNTMTQLVDELATTDLFDAARPQGETDQEFADAFAASLVNGYVTEQQEADVAQLVLDMFQSNLNAGMDRQQAKARTMHEGITAARGIEEGPFADAAQALRNKIEVAEYYSWDLQKSGDMAELQAAIAGVDETQASVDAAKARAGEESGMIFNLTEEAAAGADVARLTGDQDVRFDLTANGDQVRGLDLNGDGIISNDGVENNNPTDLDDGKDFEILDAYSRNKLNEYDTANNFLGDIEFDGTGFDGDGVNTDGNIFLGGLGADTALGGIGNDFMVGGGVSQARVQEALADWLANGYTWEAFWEGPEAVYDHLQGGRNADFFFGELSLLDNTDGNQLFIDGGSTSDDAAAGNNTPQDSDWLLLEVSDDEDGTVVDLSDEDWQYVTTGAGRSIDMEEIEHFDGSGNLYGFVDDVDVALGGNGQMVNGENVGIGSSAQLVIYGSEANNILIGGFDNDLIEGGEGNDLLMGGRLDYNNNPNLQGIVNDGMDELFGEDGDDNIVMELDGGIIDGGYDHDTLWLTELTFGTQNADDMTSDGVVRIDLGNNYDEFQGYGGADVFGTHDQTHYTDSSNRVDANNMESVIATGLGGIDYLAAGANDPELLFNNQQNIGGIDADLDLRGTDTDLSYVIGEDGFDPGQMNGSGGEDFNDPQYEGEFPGSEQEAMEQSPVMWSGGDNVLYANTGDDVIEGRRGNDKLSGGEGNDDFIFHLGSVYEGWGEDAQQVAADGVDVIHRQVDADGDNIWDTDENGNPIYGQDFGLDKTVSAFNSTFTLGLPDTLAPYVDGIVFELGGVEYTIDGLGGVATDLESWVETLEAALANQAGLENVSVSIPEEGVAVMTDADGREFVELQDGWLLTGGSLPSDGLDQWYQEVGAPETDETQDRLIYRAYEDRADGELRDDDAVLGSNVSLGNEGYAEDLVINFAEDGTRIAEDQAYSINFTNLTTQDTVTIHVNGVEFSLQVGVDLDGNIIGAEDGPFDQQPVIQSTFLARLTGFINSFMDDDTAAGQVRAQFDGDDTITLTQVDYNGEETVFMTTPEVEIGQLSGGEQASASVINHSQHEVHLLDFDGRDGNLNEDNVLFLGDTGINRAALQTADNDGDTIQGKQAVLIDNADDTHAADVANTGEAIADSQATNQWLDGSVDIYAVHGDDLLIGGDGNDTIMGGTGDDRVIGSLGQDELDGGKNYYSVQVLGESEARVYELNNWESENFSIPGEVISSIDLIDQAESGVTTISGRFDDTLLFQQADFEPGQTEFTITLNDYVVNNGVVELQNDGAGTVDVDVEGDGTFESTTTFTNFENIRTVSGVGAAVAGNGQGNDTLDVGGMSTDTGGISYNLTNDGGQGQVRYSSDDIITNPPVNDRPWENDYDMMVLRVDGVENVIGGSGDDLLVIDETEAAKNNEFWGNAGTDRIEYRNNYNGTSEPEPTVTIKVNTGNDTDEVVMTGGRVGSTVATDTLVGVEYVGLYNATATGPAADDVIDVTAMTSGAVVDYINEEVRDLNGNVQMTIENMFEMENVWADGDDTVIVADDDVMDNNANHTNDNVDITFATFMDYDELDGNDQRIPFSMQSAGQIQDVENLNLFTFDLSKTGGGNDTDTVDYSQTDDSIATVVQEGNLQHVLVDGDSLGDDFDNGAVDRVDQLIGVEQIVASQSESVLDFTSMGEEVEISFQFDENNADNATDTMENVVRIGDANGDSIQGIPSYVERWDMNNNANVDPFNSVSWNRIEGGDAAERVLYDGSEDLTNLAGVDHRYSDDVLNLRGGDNEVSYNELETSINAVVDIQDASTTSTITATIDFEDGTGTSTMLPGAGTHTITSHTSDNVTSAGNLKIAASQDAEDSVEFSNNSVKIYILGTSAGVIDVQIGALDTMRLTGFEILQDGDTNDVYDMQSLLNVSGNLTLSDGTTGFFGDHDTIKVGGGAAANAYNGGAGNTVIDLAELNTVFGFDFDVLDVTNVTSNNVTTLNGETGGSGGTDEVVLGTINNIATLNDFESVVFTQDSVDENGNVFSLDTDSDTLSAGGRDLDVSGNNGAGAILSGYSADAVVSFRGLVLEDGTVDGGQVANVSDGITFTVSGNDDVAVFGGDGDDTITGAGGNDIIVGGMGADVMDGSFVPAVQEVHTFTLSGQWEAGTADSAVTFNGFTVTEGDNVQGTVVADGADADAIGAAIVREWDANPSSFTDESLIDSITYDGVSNALTVTFVAGPQLDSEIGAPVLTAGTDANTFAVGPETVQTQGAAQAEAVDTFIYLSAAESTESSMDQILNFSVGTTDDIIDLSAIDANPGTPANDAFAGVNNGGSGYADVNAAKTAADAAFGGSDIFVGSDGTDTWVFVDTDQSGDLGADDMMIQLTGIDATGINAGNFAL